MGLLAIVFCLDVLVSSLCIWLASKTSFVDIEPKQIPLIVVVVSIVSLIPTIGWVLGLITFAYLLMKSTDCDLKDAFWVILFTKLFSTLVILTLVGAST